MKKFSAVLFTFFQYVVTGKALGEQRDQWRLAYNIDNNSPLFWRMPETNDSKEFLDAGTSLE